MAGDDQGSLGSALRPRRERAGSPRKSSPGEPASARTRSAPSSAAPAPAPTLTRCAPCRTRSTLAEAERARPGRAPSRPGRARRPPPGTPPPRVAHDAAGAADPAARPRRGRRRVAGLVADRRLVTLTGAGGVGKTRLALAVAGAPRPVRRRGGARRAGPAAATTGGAARRRRRASDATGSPGGPAEDVVDRLREQQLLLVLDNFEHLLDAAPDVAGSSRPLPASPCWPRAGHRCACAARPSSPSSRSALPRRAAGRDSPAVRLLLDRAGPSPRLGHRTGRRRRCRGDLRAPGRAAARPGAGRRPRPAAGPAALLARLDARPGGRGRATCRAAAHDARHPRLELRPAGADEQTALRLLGVFAGGFSLDDLEAVAARAGTPRAAASLAGGAGRALAGAPAPGGSPLPDAGAGGAVRPRRCSTRPARGRGDGGPRRAFLALAEATAPRYRDGGQVAALARIDPEHANLIAAAERGLAAGDATRRPGCLGAVDVLVAARPPRPRTPAGRGGAGPRRCPTTSTPAPSSPRRP